MKQFTFLLMLTLTGLSVFSQTLINDNCAGATELIVDASCLQGTNVGATNDGNPSCGLITKNAQKTVWYYFFATSSNTQISVTNITGDLDVIVMLYNACGETSFKCVNATGNNQNESVYLNTVYSNLYMICIDGSANIWPFPNHQDGNFCIQVSNFIAPSNPSVNCSDAQPFCTGTTYQFPAGTNTQAQVGPNYGCLGTQFNPAWYYLKTATEGAIDIHIESDVNKDVDFICWGPFPDLGIACSQISSGGGSQIDCSYSIAYAEDCNIPNAQVGEYYMLLITTYPNQPSNIIFSQTGGSGSTDCSTINPIIVQNNGPLCSEQTLNLVATYFINAIYSWVGPSGFISSIRNPVIPNVLVAQSGVYILTTTVGTNSYTSTTHVTIYEKYSLDNLNNPISICQGQNYIFNGHTYVTTGIYYDTLLSINGCDSIIKTNLNVNSLPNAGISTIVATCSYNNQFNLFASLNGSPDQNGTWYDDDSTGALTNSIFNPSLVNLGIYHFTYIVTGISPCSTAQSTITVGVDICENINEINKIGVQIFPNPANDKVYINSVNNNYIVLFVYSMQGNLVLQKSFSGNTNIDIKTWPVGIYCIKQIIKNGIFIRKFIKE